MITGERQIMSLVKRMIQLLKETFSSERRDYRRARRQAKHYANQLADDQASQDQIDYFVSGRIKI